MPTDILPIPVYFMPGMSANRLIFEKIKLPEDRFSMHFLEWKTPYPNESVRAYSARMADEIKHANPVLLGVSFGGIIVQEMSKLIPTRKLVIVSSVKSNCEFPKKFKFAQITQAYKLFPTGLVANLDILQKLAFGDNLRKRLISYEKYLTVRDKIYLNWALDAIVNWSQEEPLKNTIHIHGTEDLIFPVCNIENYVAVKGGDHAMILSKSKWFNEHLPEIILK
ncbi:MAG: alpha/beta hydrolase [Flavobacteriales bacterium CG_4_9_14_3_um_filter_40_17]|nr:MAG: alpha/beta hydrolase [Flavobacteriales bacterium CG_4_9_14_3_um_filter_40_17]